MTQIRTSDGDTISGLLLVYLGRNDDTAEKALHRANPDLMYHGPVLRSGVVITLPELPAPAPEKVTNIWD